jgi:hypothetical protein
MRDGKRFVFDGDHSIAVIAAIAHHRRNRKTKTLPLMNADERG